MPTLHDLTLYLLHKLNRSSYSIVALISVEIEGWQDPEAKDYRSAYV